MPLVDYASDEDDDGEECRRMDEDAAPTRHDGPASSSTQVPVPASTSSTGPGFPTASRESPVLLPSAAELFGASMQAGSSNPSGDAHVSRVSAIMAMSRKRPQLNGGAHPIHHTKIPRGNSAPSTRETTGGTLMPPQLRGRSNIATEDLDKLFVHRQQRRSE